MTKALEGLTVGLTERRYADEMSKLFAHFGASLDVVPVFQEKLPDDRTEIARFVNLVVSRAIDIVVFTTGIGVRFLVAEADVAGSEATFLEGLRNLTVVARGSKTVAALNHWTVPIALRAQDPTTDGIIDVLRTRDLAGKRIAVQLWGDPNPRLGAALEALGASVFATQAYVYAPVSDSEEIKGFVRRLIDGRIDVLALTSAPQVRPVLEAAACMGVQNDLVRALNDRVVVAAIGEVTGRALSEFGIHVRIIPSSPKMGAMVSAIANFFTCEVQ